MKNVTFIAGPKSGSFVNTRLSALHHSGESRLGVAETVFACLVVAALVGFAMLVVN
ncbi:MAG TPA: hypothetical protein VFV96_03660 [Verrucomicrobiae bacterium]|nr:hypothetical protein [Verrucomicrobiae bacterium]